MSYTTDDFAESLSRVGITPQEIDTVVAAWGYGSGMGTDAGHFKWDKYGASDWNGGFLMRMVTGGFKYLTGWCDYTGWGCQDGASVADFAEQPMLESLKGDNLYDGEPPADQWDLEPADLNRWLKNPVDTWAA